MTRLTDTQSLLLATAAKRDTLGLYPLPSTLKPSGELLKTIAALQTRGFVEERETTDKGTVAREDGGTRHGLFVTPAGLAAIGVQLGDETTVEENTTAQAQCEPQPQSQPPLLKAQSKTATVLALLQRQEGATLDQLVTATGWLPHTTRAALTGLKKKGYETTSEKAEGTRTYRVFPPVSR